MKKDFLTGLTILLPVVLTLIILRILLNLITAPFLGLATTVVNELLPPDSSFLFFSHEFWVNFLSKIFIVVGLAGTLFAIGYIGGHFLVESVFQLGEKLMNKVPIIRQIYKWTKDVAKLVFDSEKQKFSQVVLLPFPHKGAYSLGFITSDEDKEKISVFVPGTPNPTVGYMLTMKHCELEFLDIKVEDALKIVVSCQFPSKG